MKIVEYKNVMGSELSILKSHVDSAIKQGWQPLGGIGVGMRNFYQTMVRYESKTEIIRVEQLPDGGKRLHRSDGTFTEVHPNSTEIR